MEPVTHLLTGACLGRSGFNRKTAYATLAMTLAAEAPDIDVIAGWGGPVTGFCHHRGITHSFFGAPFMALAVTGVVWLLAKLFARLRRKPPTQPVRWLWIWFLALIADLSHLLLDYTNNYGLRPFLPFNSHWYSWSIVFIFEPLLFAALVLGLAMPALLGLVEGEMRRRAPGELRGRGWAIAALVFAGLLYSLRDAEHIRALRLAKAAGSSSRQPVLRVAAEPVMVNPFLWHTLIETRDGYETGTAHTLAGLLDSGDVVAKPPVTPDVAIAKQTYLGRVYGDWSSWPLIEDVGTADVSPGAPDGNSSPPMPGSHTVIFRDLRFSPEALGSLAGSGRGGVLSGLVVVDAHGQVTGEWMDGRRQR